MTYRPWPERVSMGPFPGGVTGVPGSYPFKDGLSGDEAAERTIDYITTHIGARICRVLLRASQGDGGVRSFPPTLAT
ncbi:hypothetical protein [Humibacter ginsenosidimutans]|uniref:hypothetical protein n=1 Tax=Humibacter ginsenosidimutans TaxID=2599293 RepID=UPI001FEE4173|nr:hypothetical protein [Humibacter ginsenosidimutans]